jgi:mannose-6-phosphate isomerase-like protein (cupin superfamily)
MAYTIFRPGEVEWTPRAEDDSRSIARLSDALTQSRANLWRYPPGTKGKRHLDRAQEEVFVVLEGMLTVDLGDPPERHEVPRGGVLVVESGTILQLRNVGAEELVLFIYGAPPVTGQGEFFPDVE